MAQNTLKQIFDLTLQKKQIEKTLKALWDKVESEGITSQGAYLVDVKEIQVRSIVPELFRNKFGQELFNTIASVSLKDALAEVGEAHIADCVEHTTRTQKSVVCAKAQAKTA